MSSPPMFSGSAIVIESIDELTDEMRFTIDNGGPLECVIPLGILTQFLSDAILPAAPGPSLLLAPTVKGQPATDARYLPATNFPALEGDVTTEEGSLSATVAKINGNLLGSTSLSTPNSILMAIGNAWVSTPPATALAGLGGASTGIIYQRVTNTASITAYTGNSPGLETAGYSTAGDGFGARYTKTAVTGAPTFTDANNNVWYLEDPFGYEVNIGHFGPMIAGQDISVAWTAADIFANHNNKCVFIPAVPGGGTWLLTQPMAMNGAGLRFEYAAQVQFTPAVITDGLTALRVNTQNFLMENVNILGPQSMAIRGNSAQLMLYTSPNSPGLQYSWQGQATVAGVTMTVTQYIVGQLEVGASIQSLAGSLLPAGTVINAIAGNIVTLSHGATVSGAVTFQTTSPNGWIIGEAMFNGGICSCSFVASALSGGVLTLAAGSPLVGTLAVGQQFYVGTTLVVIIGGAGSSWTINNTSVSISAPTSFASTSVATNLCAAFTIATLGGGTLAVQASSVVYGAIFVGQQFYVGTVLVTIISGSGLSWKTDNTTQAATGLQVVTTSATGLVSPMVRVLNNLVGTLAVGQRLSGAGMNAGPSIITSTSGTFTAKIDNGAGAAGNELTVSGITHGTVQINQLVYNSAGVSTGLTVLSQSSGTTGGTGVYVLSGSALLASQLMTQDDNVTFFFSPSQPLLAGPQLFTTTNLPNISAVKDGCYGIVLANNGYCKNVITDQFKFGIVVTEVEGHIDFLECSPQGFCGYHIANNGYNYNWFGGDANGIWAAVSCTNFGLSGVEGAFYGTQLGRLAAYGLYQFSVTGQSGSNGFNGTMRDVTWENNLEAAIEVLPSSSSYVKLDHCTWQPNNPVPPANLSTTITPTAQQNILKFGNLGYFEASVNLGNQRGIWQGVPLSGAAYPQYSITASVLELQAGLIDLRYFDSSANINFVGSQNGALPQWNDAPRHPTYSSKLDASLLTGLADTLNLAVSPELQTNWTSNASTTAAVTVIPWASSIFAGTQLPQEAQEYAGVAPVVIEIQNTAGTGPQNAVLSVVAALANVGINNPLFIHAFAYSPGAGATIGLTLRTNDGIAKNLYGNVPTNVFSTWQRFCFTNETLGDIGSTTGTLTELIVSSNNPGSTVYLICVMAGTGEPSPYNPLSQPFSSRGIAFGDPTGVNPNPAAPLIYSDPHGNLHMSAPPADGTLKTPATPVASGSYVTPALVKTVHFNNSASIAGYTITLPDVPTSLTTDTIAIDYFFDGPMTTLSWAVPNANVTLSGAAQPATIAAGNKVTWQWFPTNSTSGKWFHAVGA